MRALQNLLTRSWAHGGHAAGVRLFLAFVAMTVFTSGCAAQQNPQTPPVKSQSAQTSASPAADSSAVAALEQAIARLAAGAGGVVGVSAIHVETGRRVSFNGGGRFPMASVYKFPIGLQILRQVDRGELRLSDALKIGEHDFRPGYSPITETASAKPATYTLQQLFELMVGESDNAASDRLLKLAGGGAAVMAALRGLGVEGIDVSRSEGQLISEHRGVRELPPESEWTMKMFDEATKRVTPAEREAGARRYAEDPRDTSTPDGMADLLVRIHKGGADVLSPANLALLKKIMTETKTGPKRIKGLLPAGTVVTHKTGTMGGTTNDVGIITLPNGAGHVALAVFVKASDKEVAERERAIAEIARAVYDHFLRAPGRGGGSI